MGAVQVSVVPELLVPEATNPVGAAGTAEQLGAREPPPQDGRRIRAVMTRQRRHKTRTFFRCLADEARTNPASASPETGSHKANGTFIPDGVGPGFDRALATTSLLPDSDPRTTAGVPATDINVSVDVPPLPLVTDTGFGLKLHIVPLVPLPLETEHERVTLPVYPFPGFTCTVAVAVPPGAIVAGLAGPAESE